MAKLNIRTLNGIRTAALPSGRDVAEALDDIVAALAKVSNSIPQSGPAVPTPNTQAPQTAPIQKITGIGQPVPTNGLQGVTTFTGDGTVLVNSASTGSVVAALASVVPNAFLCGPEYGSSSELPTWRYIETPDLPLGGTWDFMGILSGNFDITGNFSVLGELLDSLHSPGISGQILSSTGVGVEWVNSGGSSGVDISTAGATSPSPAYGFQECPTDVNPYIYLEDENGYWHAQAGVDTTSNSGVLSPAATLLWTRRFWFRDNNTPTQNFKNSAIAIAHAAGVGVVQTNQDRGLAVNMFNSSGVALSFSITDNIVSIIMANSQDPLTVGNGENPWFVPGQVVTASEFTTGTYLNGVAFTVQECIPYPSNPTNYNLITLYSSSFSHADVSATDDAGRLDQKMYAMECGFNELDVYGQPTFSAHVDAELCGWAITVNDNSALANANAPNDGCHAIRTEVFRNGPSSCDWACIDVQLVNNNATTTDEASYSGIVVSGADEHNGTSNAEFFGLLVTAPSPLFQHANFGVRINGTWSGSGVNYPLYIDSGVSYFGGNIQLNAELIDGTGSSGTSGYVLSSTGSAVKWIAAATGTVTDFGAGNCSPIFTTSVTNPTTTPELLFNLTPVAPNAFLCGPEFGSTSESPTYRYIETPDLPLGGTWDFMGIFSGNFDISGNVLVTGTETWGLTSYTKGISSSPALIIAGSYESSSTGPTYAEDSWTIQNNIGSGLNGTSTLEFSHAGTSGAVYVDIHTLNTTAPSLIFDGDTTCGIGRYSAAGYLSLFVGNGDSLIFYGGTSVVGALIISQSTGLTLYSNSASLPILLNPGSTNNLTSNITNGYLQINTNGTFKSVTAGQQIGAAVGGTFSPASGATQFIALAIKPTIDQISTASGNYTALLVNPTETAFLGTTALLMDLQVGGTSKFNIDHNGSVQMSAASAAPTSAGTAGTAGQIVYYGGNLYFCSVTGTAGAATWNKVNLTAV